MSFPPQNEPTAASTPPIDAASDAVHAPDAAAGPDAPDAVPPAPVETPTAVEELVAFGRAIAQSASAELSLSTASFVETSFVSARYGGDGLRESDVLGHRGLPTAGTSPGR